MKQGIVVFSICCVLSFSGCGKAAKENPASKKIDACALLTGAEIETVQGSPVTDTKGTEHSDGGLRNAQCYFATKQSSLSVSLVVAQDDPASPSKRTVREYWKETFGPDAKREKEREEEEHEREGVEPTKIEGVGEEAYWVPVRVGGALYAVKGQAFVRISVGGPDDQKQKIEKSKELAKKVLDRL